MTSHQYYLDRIVVDENDCWLWRLAKDAFGYGRGRDGSAHRGAYKAFIGPIAEGLQVDHLCRVRHCVNPQHLELVTPEENYRRAVERGFPGGRPRKTHCLNGHPMTDENIRLYPDGKYTKRVCLPCAHARSKAWRDRQ